MWTKPAVVHKTKKTKLFTPRENLFHFYKLFICLFTLLSPLPMLFLQFFLWPSLWFLSHPLLILFSTLPSFISLFIFGLEYGNGPKRIRGLNGGHREWICIICGVALVHGDRETVPTGPRWTELASPAQRLVTLTGFTEAQFTEGLADMPVPTPLAPTVCVLWETVASVIDSCAAETHSYSLRTHRYTHTVSDSKVKKFKD